MLSILDGLKWRIFGRGLAINDGDDKIINDITILHFPKVKANRSKIIFI